MYCINYQSILIVEIASLFTSLFYELSVITTSTVSNTRNCLHIAVTSASLVVKTLLEFQALTLVLVLTTSLHMFSVSCGSQVDLLLVPLCASTCPCLVNAGAGILSDYFK